MYVAKINEKIRHEFEKEQGVVYGKIWKEGGGEMMSSYNLKNKRNILKIVFKLNNTGNHKGVQITDSTCIL